MITRHTKNLFDENNLFEKEVKNCRFSSFPPRKLNSTRWKIFHGAKICISVCWLSNFNVFQSKLVFFEKSNVITLEDKNVITLEESLFNFSCFRLEPKKEDNSLIIYPWWIFFEPAL